jgi:hydroxymethylpyrimidine pyrophosphatase-like HAD family hydrolase
MPESPVPTPARRFDAVFCDIDGCLGPESHEPMDARALARLADHNRRALDLRDLPVVTLCSGRPQPFVEALCRFIANTSIPCVCENGVWVYDPRNQGFFRDPAITSDHLAWVRDATIYLERDWIPKGLVIQPGKAASISLWHPDTPTLRAALPLLERRFADEGWRFRLSMTVAWINCDLAHVSKGTGINRVLAMTDLDPTRCAGIGDSLSDLAIADRVALFAIPANADPRLKPHAAYVAHAHEIAGVFEILDHLGRP